MNIYEKLKSRYLNRKWKDRDFVIKKFPYFNDILYKKYRNYREAEHQIGRGINIQKIASEIEKQGITGDVVEFGTYQGLGLAMLRESFPHVTNRHFIGIDSFEGLPESSTIWAKGTFKDTGFLEVYRWLIKFGYNFVLAEAWFSDEEKKKRFQKVVKDICLVHFDADLGSSTTQALEWIEPYLDKHPIYFLFDDWGCHPDEVPDAFYEWKEKHPKLKADKLFSTDLTRYYRIHK